MTDVTVKSITISESSDISFSQWCVVRSIPRAVLLALTIVFSLFLMFHSNYPQANFTAQDGLYYGELESRDKRDDTGPFEDTYVTTEEPHVVPYLGNDTRYRTCRRCFVRDYKLLHMPRRVCDVLPGQKERDLQLLLFIVTKPGDFGVRRHLRTTWLSHTQRNKNARARHVFVLGRASGHGVQLMIDTEQRDHNDIVQQDFDEAYNNLTLKTMLGLEWATTRCSRARFVQKVDDDVFVNIPRVLELLTKTKQDVGLMGRCFYSKRPARGGTWKWRMPVQAYNGSRYPSYCNGPSYVLSMAAAKEIVQLSPNIPFFRIEDVYIGLCLRATKYHFKIKSNFGWMKTLFLTPWTNFTGMNCDYMRHLYTTHHTYPKPAHELWNLCFAPTTKHVEHNRPTRRIVV